MQDIGSVLPAYREPCLAVSGNLAMCNTHECTRPHTHTETRTQAHAITHTHSRALHMHGREYTLAFPLGQSFTQFFARSQTHSFSFVTPLAYDARTHASSRGWGVFISAFVGRRLFFKLFSDDEHEGQALTPVLPSSRVVQLREPGLAVAF